MQVLAYTLGIDLGGPRIGQGIAEHIADLSLRLQQHGVPTLTLANLFAQQGTSPF